MARFTLGVTDYVGPPFDLETQGSRGDIAFRPLNVHSDTEIPVQVLAELDGLLVWHASIAEAAARGLRKGAIVVRYGVGFDAIDVSALEAGGQVFSNTPDYGIEEVAETACAMILALQRKILTYDIAAREITRGWQEHVQPPLERASTRTLGVIGVGRIGTAVMRRLATFGYRLVGFDPYLPSGHEKAIGYERVHSLAELLAQSDVVSLHCPLSKETAGMVDAAFVAAMKPGAILVNVARGGLVDGLETLRGPLESGHLSAVGLDVLPDEPPRATEPLILAWRAQESWVRGRLIINNHTAYYSDQAWREMRFKAAETAWLYLTTGHQRNRITSAD